ncbi:alanine racemase [Dongia rigui]|uniref:Alanine racemase n=1 Tax=Dongia rigui TaxID=940149 RepID=A0ABU5DWN1_9PROT|nr:alanine racemase [Dongia rigui]MDY0871721.1 alanine racemase [Dongia rigui]
MPDSYSAALTIDIGAIVANYRLLAGRLSPAACGAAVKADCYGLGAAMIAPHLRRAGCNHFFVATVDEGLGLRPLLPGARIYLMNGLPPGSERDVAGNELIPILNSMAEIERWQSTSRGMGARPAGLQFDTGLNRLGLSHDEAVRLIADPHLLDGIDPVLIMSHLACADDPEHPQNRAQLRRFREITGSLRLPPRVGSIGRTLRSLAASSSIFLGADYHFDLARPGAALYGINPVLGAENPLRQVVRLQAKILQLREVDLNMTVGYGASHQFRGPSVLATIGAGYADGIFRSLGNRGAVFVAGQRAPIVGRVSMDLITIDVGHLPRGSVSPGMSVDLIGPEQNVDAVARDAGTIGYEILTNLGTRFQRRYVGAQ